MRLTERKTTYPTCDNNGNLIGVECIEVKDKDSAEEKLCQLEDIEEELGIDLITLFKALRQGVYCKLPVLEKIAFVHPTLSADLDLYVSPYITLQLGSYGKTWALTKEELENE